MKIESRKVKVLVTALRQNHTFFAGKDLAQRFQARDFQVGTELHAPDIILYLEYGYLGLTDLPELLKRVRQYPSATHFLFSEADWPYPVLPGAYPSLAQPTDWAQSWCYLPSLKNLEASASASQLDPKYLFSFLGRTSTHAVRKRLLELDADKSPCIDLDNAAKRLIDFDYAKSYLKLIAESKFVLCPRGFGTSSIRIFETMSMARVPVIISDRWQPPPGIPWNEVSVRVPERDVARIPQILRDLASEAERMGRQAREVFNQKFSPAVFYDVLMTDLIAKYSDRAFSMEANLARAWSSLGWREIRSVGNQVKSLVTGEFAHWRVQGR